MSLQMSPAEFREKHARRLKQSIEDIKLGVSRVTENPMEKAASKQEKMLQNISNAITSGKWAAGLKRVDLQDWQTAMINKGANRIGQGIDGAAAKVENFAGQLLDYEKGLKAKVDKMPDMSIEDSIARMTTWVRGMKEFRAR